MQPRQSVSLLEGMTGSNVGQHLAMSHQIKQRRASREKDPMRLDRNFFKFFSLRKLLSVIDTVTEFKLKKII
ncbi:hypothetical protein TZ03_11475 [Pseudomonas sp. 10-1B]|nr:hypothetical protein TZ03_11475 [Pseudomonas sp. 10-1B]